MHGAQANDPDQAVGFAHSLGAAVEVEHQPQSSLAPPKKQNFLWRAVLWYAAWALPGMGMFSEAYIIFSSGQIKPQQKALWPSCFGAHPTDCDADMVAHVSTYIQICGIMAGMLVWGVLADITGRKWGSRIVATIMLSGCILLTFSPYAPSAFGYFAFFMTAQTWYGFGVGGEYPLASASAAERANCDPSLRHLRGQQVVLVFSGQGMGNLTNCCVILICMAIFHETGKTLTASGSQKVLILQYGFGALSCLVMVWYRMIYLEESQMFAEDKMLEQACLPNDKRTFWRKHWVSLKYYWPRQWVASFAWVANDFAFYGNKLGQSTFISYLYPTATPFKKQQWTVLNSFIGLLGYYAAAALVDKRWYGRRLMQNVGFWAMFILYIICGIWYDQLTEVDPVTKEPVNNGNKIRFFQALYYLSSFFNQFGPNCTTWLVAGEMFPTDIRAAYHGFAATMGKLGAIIATIWFSYVGAKTTFLLSAYWSLGGILVTTIWMADTTGLELEEYDRMQRYILEDRFHEYHGEAINPRHLSYWEIYVLKWHKNYNPELNKQQLEEEFKAMDKVVAKVAITKAPESGLA